jgi:hypothetical protein
VRYSSRGRTGSAQLRATERRYSKVAPDGLALRLTAAASSATRTSRRFPRSGDSRRGICSVAWGRSGEHVCRSSFTSLAELERTLAAPPHPRRTA